MRRAAVLGLLLMAACPRLGTRGAEPPHRAAEDPVTTYLRGTLRPWPHESSEGLLAVTDPTRGRVAVYDSALVALVMMRRSQRDIAGRILTGLAELQADDGSLPFSFNLPSPDEGRAYVRSGAVAWVGYAAAEYLNAEAGGHAREAALKLAHRSAGYLYAHRVETPGDPREGLVRGGAGMFRYELDGPGRVREILVPGEIAWASVEHNVDAFFFFEAMTCMTGAPSYAETAARIGRALTQQAWSEQGGQFLRGVGERGPDPTLALDAASWGAVLLEARGDRARARASLATADARFSARDGKSGVLGHRAYASGPVLEDPHLTAHFAETLSALTWDRLDAVWPEGSAGVALAALRSGDRKRAQEILDALEPLRGRDGALPTFTVDLPCTFDSRPGIAGTAWVDLVRYELDRPPGRPTLWPALPGRPTAP